MEYGKVAQYTRDNKMVLNESKTKTMLVAGKHLRKKMSSTSLTVNVNSVELEQVQSHKLLGVIIYTQLDFNAACCCFEKYQASFTFRSTNSLL